MKFKTLLLAAFTLFGAASAMPGLDMGELDPRSWDPTPPPPPPPQPDAVSRKGGRRRYRRDIDDSGEFSLDARSWDPTPPPPPPPQPDAVSSSRRGGRRRYRRDLETRSARMLARDLVDVQAREAEILEELEGRGLEFEDEY